MTKLNEKRSMSKDKAREFWVRPSIGDGDDAGACFDAKFIDGYIHVIEHKAYAALEAKLAECVDVLERLAKYESAQRGQAGLQSMIVDARETLAKVKR